ncbi:MAG: hypothetical protein M3Z26_06980 [Bacteroidota bacterium]|nr:hypothetical protein [Bacteroidota bacterium]
MDIQEQIEKFITSQPEPKRSDMEKLHMLILQVLPECKLWFDDGKNSENKTISNPGIGYGIHTMKYSNGKTREFFQIGMSANKAESLSISLVSGISYSSQSNFARNFLKQFNMTPTEYMHSMHPKNN